VRRFAGALGVVLLAGCGSSARTVTRGESAGTGCNGIAADLTFHYAICDGHRFVRNGKRLSIDDPPGARVGHWAKAFLSPDGKTFLAQWSAECEVPIAFFVPVQGGLPQTVSGEDDWMDSPASAADGWTSDGRAIVEFPQGPCSRSIKRPGVYIVQLDGRRKLVAPIVRQPGP
jgi:hypothetical protein